MRKAIGGLWSLVTSAALGVQFGSEYDARPLWIAAVALAALWVIWGPLMDYIVPTASVRRGVLSDGWSIHFRPAPKRTRGRLKRQSLRLAKKMHAVVDRFPLKDYVDEQYELKKEMESAASDQEKSEIWTEELMRSIGESAEVTAELEKSFAGSLSALLAQYERLGMIDGHEATRIQRDASDPSWLRRAATALEALAKRL
jgi:hypothetical protein